MRRSPWCLCSLWWVLDRQRLQPSTAVLQRQSDKLTTDDSVNSLDPPKGVRGTGDRGVRTIIARRDWRCETFHSWRILPHYFQKTQQRNAQRERHIPSGAAQAGFTMGANYGLSC